MQRHGCTAPRFVDVPESLDGPFVFRNGFHEALGLSTEASKRYERGVDPEIGPVAVGAGTGSERAKTRGGGAGRRGSPAG
jgi:hypothetical protein